jgi:hypothetical protein
LEILQWYADVFGTGLEAVLLIEVGERLVGKAGCACCVSKETSLAVVDTLSAEVLG